MAVFIKTAIGALEGINLKEDKHGLTKEAFDHLAVPRYFLMPHSSHFPEGGVQGGFSVHAPRLIPCELRIPCESASGTSIETAFYGP